MESKALNRLRRKLTVENLWLYIIKILLDEKKPLRAYDIKVRLRDIFTVNPPAITVYTVVYRMTREGLLVRKTKEGEVVYEVTEKGLEVYKKGILLMEEILSKLKL